MIRFLTAIAALLAVWTLASAPAAAKEWQVKGDLIGKLDKDGAPKPSKDMSGIACATETGFPRTCLVIDDDLQAAQIVTLTDGKIKGGDAVPLIADLFKGKPVSLDGEGVAYAGGYFYVIGSHGRPRSTDESQPDEQARIAAGVTASSKLVRLKYDAATGALTGNPEVSSALRALIEAEPLFDEARQKELEQNGLTIEGIAVAGDRLFAGFRGPVIGERAVVMSAALGHFFDGKPADAKLYQIDLGEGRGVRDLAAYGGGILILAGPVKSENGTYSIFRWDGAGAQAKLLEDLPAYFSKEEAKKKHGDQWKPEALLPLDRNAKGLRVLLLLDSAKNGKPRSVRIPYP